MAEAGASTPLMDQYRAVQARYPGHLVLFRVGDFYETFGEDAKLLSRELEVVLTARSSDSRGERIPMAGVPHHAVESYLGRLVRKGYKVALCDQVEDARFAKGLVRREVTRVVTPGTVIEDRILPGPEHNFLVAIALPEAASAAFGAVDVTTGELYTGIVEGTGPTALLLALAPFAPREILLPLHAAPGSRESVEAALHGEFPSARLEAAPSSVGRDGWPAPLVASATGLPAPEEEVVGRIVRYVAATQPRLLPFLERLPRAPGDRRLRLDGKTLRHLEITRPMNPEGEGSPTLLSTWSETVTGPGRRTLGFWLRNPLSDVPAIVERQDAVAALLDLGEEMGGIRDVLRRVADLSRITARLAGRRLRPPELAAVRSSLQSVVEVRSILGAAGRAPATAALAERLDPLPELAHTLAAALPDEPPATVESGGLFRHGFHAGLDAARAQEEEALQELETLERTEALASGIKSLKIGYNQVFGYYFEVTRPHLARVPPHFRRKQTLSGAERFTSDALTALETRILEARERASEAELGRWEAFLAELEPEIPRLHRLSRAVGELDVLLAFAWIAYRRGYVRPLVDESTTLSIRAGRHPVLDVTLGERFVPNDTELDLVGTRLVVLTGPNMSGKSTYMRQVGLLVVLAQVGAFLPVASARIGRVSALYTRMGFTDEIARGKSSFMVEMTEVAEILASADERSLVLLDEVGRGTSTFDGLALAWATLREFHDRIRCRVYLATHYHQLSELTATLPGAATAHLAVEETGRGIVFLHRLVAGGTDRSFGIHVARLAGMPPGVVEEAERLLARLESGGLTLQDGARRPRSERPRFAQAVLLPTPMPPEDIEAAQVREALAALDTDRVTPMEALALLAEWKRRLHPAGTER
jgi:DNA mismatch repair protein MutS